MALCQEPCAGAQTKGMDFRLPVFGLNPRFFMIEDGENLGGSLASDAIASMPAQHIDRSSSLPEEITHRVHRRCRLEWHQPGRDRNQEHPLSGYSVRRLSHSSTVEVTFSSSSLMMPRIGEQILLLAQLHTIIHLVRLKLVRLLICSNGRFT